MNFFGYNDESQLRQHHADADAIIAKATMSPVTVCSEGKECVGSLDGKRYIYADGSHDYGRPATKYRAEHKGNIFAWYLK